MAICGILNQIATFKMVWSLMIDILDAMNVEIKEKIDEKLLFFFFRF